jgi:hypothetical protein
VKPDDLAACQVTPGSEWILAKVIQHDPVSGMYKLADEDVESDKGLCRICTRYVRVCWVIEYSLLSFFSLSV